MQRIRNLHIIPLIIFSCVFTLKPVAQGSACPDNIDFEQGNFNNWECRVGRVSLVGGSNTVTVGVPGQVPNRHTIIPASDGSMDQYGLFPVKCPNGSGYSVRLGNNSGGSEAESITYTYSIPVMVSVFSIFFHYAVVLQDPNHSPEEQPRFRARIFNVTDNMPIDCVNFDFTASASLPGFQVSPFSSGVLYKDWTPITLNLTGYAGKTIQLEFISSDCTRGGHFGYAYLDVNSSCNGAISGSTICPGDNTSTLTAPYGFQNYTWYSDISFSTVVGNSQTLFVDPPPAVGTVYPVVVVPYPGFGCRDTVYATISLGERPIAKAGPDVVSCSNLQGQLGAPPEPDRSYSWDPPALVSNPVIANPRTVPGLTGPTTYFLKVTNNLSGCIAYDTVIATPILLDTSLVMTGGNAFCKRTAINTSLMLTASGTSIQWYQNTTPIPGATSNQYNPRPAQSTAYWASIAGSGCIDSTRQVLINILPYPQPWFTMDNTIQCIKMPVEFINKSTLSGGGTLSYIWTVSDGSTYTDKDLLKSFTSPGTYEIKLKAISDGGCPDSTSKQISVIDYCNIYVPTAFTPNNDGKNDVFKPILYGIKKLHRFSVYDRAGMLIYSTQSIGEGWDGNYKGLKLTSSVFVWSLEYDSPEQKNVYLKGTVTLLR